MTEYLSKYRGKRVLVTGGTGAIGSNLSLTLSRAGARRVVILDNLSASFLFNIPKAENITFTKGDLLDTETIQRVFAELNPEYVFHMAAFFANQKSIEHPETDLLINGLGTLKLIREARKYPLKSFIYASSGVSVYPSKAPLPFKESDATTCFSTPYQITKKLGEEYCSYFAKNSDFPAVRARIFSSYGPGELPGHYRNVIPNFIFRALCEKPLIITGSGRETRDFTYVQDVIEGLLRAGASNSARGEAINIASGKEICINELAALIKKSTNSNLKLAYSNRRKWDDRNRVRACIKKAANLTGYRPRWSLEKGLHYTIRWFRKNFKKIRKNYDSRDINYSYKIKL